MQENVASGILDSVSKFVAAVCCFNAIAQKATTVKKCFTQFDLKKL